MNLVEYDLDFLSLVIEYMLSVDAESSTLLDSINS